ncbi:uncharacterized protein LOC141793239 isoform X2 [Halichoeres trimaculatus]|uniref:uncharacterized protein LOC141793239 isoform X2 n=1 Tax=Halichoeres trimaculatus TaxID=147232 RepID=UPI003D9E850C
MVNGEMWCYQKPGFEALLLAELQRQQQCNQFCDTLLKTDGVSVPAHSCVLSAISPQISSSLSSMPPPHAGQSRFLEFRALDSSTLLQLVRLLYSGQMAGQGEEERQEAVSAAARLGIHGLVEVTKGKNEAAESQHKEVGVQTEPVIPMENEERWGRWRREERDGDTFLWREKMSQSEKDTWTQTEELQVDTAPASYQAASFETIDIGALQTLGQTDPNLHQTQIPYIPVSFVCPPNSNQNHVTPCADPKRWWAEELEDEQLEQFHDNIPGYINYFLNPYKEEGRRPRGRPRGSRASRTRGAGRAGARVRGARTPRASARGRGRGRGGLTQMVDVQSVGVSKMQKMFLHRWEMRMPRTGQGGGAVGKKLSLKTRELLKQTKNCPRRRRRYHQEWEFSLGRDTADGGESNQQQGGLSAQRVVNKPTSASFSTPPVRFYSPLHPFSASSSTLQPSPSPRLLSSAASCQLPASSLIHTTPVPPQNLPPNEPEHMDRLLEEVMTVLLETGPKHVGGVGGSGGRGTSGPSVPVLQQQGEGELNDMLENFLQSFEQHVESSSTREETEKQGQSCAEAALSKYRRARSDKAGSLQSRLPLNTSSPAPKKPAGQTASPVKAPPTRRKRKRRKINQFAFPLEKKKARARARKPVSSSEAKDRTVPDQGDKQLLQMPVVKLERSGPLPESVTLQGRCRQSLEEFPALTNSTSSSVKFPHGGWERKVYPIRSRFKNAHITDSSPFLHGQSPDKKHQATDNPGLKKCSPKKKKQLGSLRNEEGSLSPVQQQLPMFEHVEKNQEKQGEELNVQTKEGRRRTGKKRRAESDETNSDATETKRLCCEQLTQTACSASAESATTERDDVNTSVRDGLQKEGCREKLTRREESAEDEDIDVDEDDEDDCHQLQRESTSVSPPSPSPSPSPSSGEDNIDEDIDVIGGSSPAPDPVIISWSDSSGGEEEEGEEDEDLDVVGEKMDYAPSALLTSRKELWD